MPVSTPHELLEALKDVKAHLAAAECQLCPDDDQLISAHIRHALRIARAALAKAPYECKFCGSASWIEQSDQSAPPDYCHPEDHGEAINEALTARNEGRTA